MPIGRRTVLTGALTLPAIRRANAAPTIKIGILSDMSGPYAEASGPGDFLAAQMAAEDFAKLHPEIKVEVLQGDMLLKPDVGAAIARGWLPIRKASMPSSIFLSPPWRSRWVRLPEKRTRW